MTALLILCTLYFVLQIPQPVQCRKEALFRKHAKQYLANNVIETKQAGSEFECGMYCLRRESCASANYKSSGIGKGRCELNAKTLQEVYEETNPEFNHLVMVEKKYSDPASSCNSTRKTQNQTTIPSNCSIGNWTISFESEGWSKCDEENLFITGFYRSSGEEMKRGVFVRMATFSTDFIARISKNYQTSTGQIAADPGIILSSMDRVMMKMLEHRSIKKDGQTVLNLGITLLAFIVGLVSF